MMYFQGGKEITPDSRISFETKPGDPLGEVVMICKSAVRNDEGDYSITLKNPKGQDTVNVKVAVLGTWIFYVLVLVSSQ